MAWLVLLVACTIWPTPPTPDPPPAPTELARPTEEASLPPPAPDGRYAATHLLISWSGAADSESERSRAAALELARALHEQVSDGASLEALAVAHSDGPSGPRGGGLGIYQSGTMLPQFEAAVASVDIGELAPLVTTPFGFHVIRRDAVLVAEAAHIVVPWHGCWRATATRSKQEARERIGEAAALVRAGRPFADVAAEFSEDATAPHGGRLGEVGRGQLLPAVDDALFALVPGQTSEVVESSFGFHLVHRLPSQD